MATNDRASWLTPQGLTEADLEANRRGRLSSTQADRVRADVSARTRMVAIAMLLGAAGACGAIAMNAAEASSLLVAVPVLLAVEALVAFLIIKLVIRRPIAEVDDGSVTAVSGTLDRVAAYPARGGFTTWIAGQRYLGLRLADLGKVLKDGDAVKAYTLQRSKVIVAIEVA